MAISSNRPWHYVASKLACTIFFSLAIFIILIPSSSAIIPARRLVPRDDDTIATPTQSNDNGTSTAPIAFSSALSLASSISNQLAQLTSIPAIPLPSNITNYIILSQMAGVMPPLQASTSGQETAIVMPTQSAQAASDDSLAARAEGLYGRQTATRVMIVGDSMTQGQQGDWTWRYRIWEWFGAQGVAVDFVGPYAGTLQPDSPSAPSPPPLFGETQPASPLRVSGGYAVGVTTDFDSDHFAVWGRAVAVDKGLIQDVVAGHQADLMLLMLGFNDLGWFYSDAPGTLSNLQTFITNARAANPNLKFAIANIPQRTFIGGRDDLPLNTDIYNGLLRNAIPGWSTTQSPIYLVELQENYDCGTGACPAGYDGLHPNALGEYQIARAFSLTLVNDFNMGTSPLAIPDDIPARPLPVPSNFQAATSNGGVTATWDAVYGAYGYDVQSRISGITDFSTGSVTTNRWDAHWPIDGFVYDVQIRASAGDTIKSDWTTIVSAIAHPLTAPGPLNIVVGATATGFDISWDPPTGLYTDSIVEYNIIYWDKDGVCSYITGAAFTSSPAHIDGLVPGHHYLVAAVTWNAAGEGFPELANSVTIGAGTPAPPTDLIIIATDPTTIHATWTGSSDAAGYRLYSRNVNIANSVSTYSGNSVEYTCADVAWLFPGTWNFAWCITAFNGNAESAQGVCVTAPSPVSGAAAAQTCPPAPEWCPDGSGDSGGATSTSIPITVPINTPSSTATTTGVSISSQKSRTITTNTGIPVSSNQPWPIVTNGQCKGPDCSNGHCTGLFCISFGCIGIDCLNGICIDVDCIVLGCIGPGCTNGACTGAGCVTKGCVGSQCGNSGQCTGVDCVSVGCSGSDCGSDGICNDPDCVEQACSGADCANGACSGTACTNLDSCTGTDCNNDGSSSHCLTATATSCATNCVGSSCSTSCSTVAQCSATNTDSFTSQTPAPAFLANQEPWPTDTTENSASDAAAQSYIDSYLSSLYYSVTNNPGGSVPIASIIPPATPTSAAPPTTPTSAAPPTTPTSTAPPAATNFPPVVGSILNLYTVIEPQIFGNVISYISSLDIETLGGAQPIDYCETSFPVIEYTDSFEPPTSIASIPKVFGDTCSYQQTVDWASASDNSVVGLLNCPTLGQASCYKTSSTNGCDGGFIFELFAQCQW